MAHGHLLETICTYSMRQLEVFVELARLRIGDEYSAVASVTRAAYHANADGFVKMLKELEGGG